MAVKISLYLDDRKKLDPKLNAAVKLRLYVARDEIKHYNTNIYLTSEQFEQSYLANKPKKKFLDMKVRLEGIVAKANTIVTKMDDLFLLERFEREMFRETANQGDMIAHYDEYIKRLNQQGRSSTADSYRLSLRSLREFVDTSRKAPVSRLAFKNITPDFLYKYESWMKQKKRSNATIGIYLRSLRAVFNQAIAVGDVSIQLYPFKKGKYKIPTGKNIKKSLNKEDLKILYTTQVPVGSEMEKARAFWFFSYQCNGMNFRDIAELKYKQVTGKSFSFIRRKTMNTSKDDPRLIVIPLTDNIKGTIKKYGNVNKSADQYVFPIFTNKMDEDDKLRANRNFIRFVNQHMNKLAKLAGLDINLSTYVARHTFTTSAIRSGASMEFVQETLGHHSMSTTQNYWAGFEDEVKEKFAESLMDF
jgi:site-specific recombinase XerD